MSIRNIQQGIQSIRNGQMAEGARFIKIGLKDDQIPANIRATAYLWLAETTQDPQQKLDYYKQALQAEPGNQQAQQNINVLLASGLGTPPPSSPQQPPPPPQSAPPSSQPMPPQQAPPTQPPGGYGYQQQPYHDPNKLYRTVGIFDGPNGPASGIIITREGLIATTRFAIGGEQHLTVELDPGQRFPGRVVRAYPALDLAFINTSLNFTQLLPTSPTPVIQDNTPLVAVAHNGGMMQGKKRATRSQTSPEWFPTTIAQMMDVGGNPVFDNRNLLVGMLTSNANRSSAYVFGLTIDAIYRHVQHLQQELQSGAPTAYCPHCGHRSRAGGAGAFYCEVCGGVLPQAQNQSRYQMPHLASYYNENAHQPCVHCGARVGYYNGRCLRCGRNI